MLLLAESMPYGKVLSSLEYEGMQLAEDIR
jgi:hypothetical protein